MYKKLQKCLFLLAVGGIALQTASCVPTRSQINGMINSSIMNGIGYVITTGIASVFAPPTTAATGT